MACRIDVAFWTCSTQILYFDVVILVDCSV